MHNYFQIKVSQWLESFKTAQLELKTVTLEGVPKCPYHSKGLWRWSKTLLSWMLYKFWKNRWFLTRSSEGIWFSGMCHPLHFLWKTDKNWPPSDPISPPFFFNRTIWFPADVVDCLLDSSTDSADHFGRELLLPCFSGCSYIERKKSCVL